MVTSSVNILSDAAMSANDTEKRVKLLVSIIPTLQLTDVEVGYSQNTRRGETLCGLQQDFAGIGAPGLSAGTPEILGMTLCRILCRWQVGN